MRRHTFTLSPPLLPFVSWWSLGALCFFQAAICAAALLLPGFPCGRIGRREIAFSRQCGTLQPCVRRTPCWRTYRKVTGLFFSLAFFFFLPCLRSFPHDLRFRGNVHASLSLSACPPPEQDLLQFELPEDALRVPVRCVSPRPPSLLFLPSCRARPPDRPPAGSPHSVPLTMPALLSPPPSCLSDPAVCRTWATAAT